MLEIKYLIICANDEDCFLVSAGDIRLAIGDLVEFEDDNKRVFARVVMYWSCISVPQAERIVKAWSNGEPEEPVQPIKAVYRKVL